MVVNRIFKKDYRILFLIIYIHILLISLVISIIYPIQLSPHPLFSLELLEVHWSAPYLLYPLLSIVNVFLVWLIGINVINGFKKHLPGFIFAICFWPIYLASGSSFYIFLLAPILLTYLGLIYIIKLKSKLGIILTVVGVVISFYSSVLMLPLFLMQLVIALGLSIIRFNQIKFVLFLVIILSIPLGFIMFGNIPGVKGVFNNEVRITSNTGEFATINVLRSESNRSGFLFQSKIVENKYAYLSKHLIYKVLTNLSPINFFAPEEKLLNFSFSSPIFLGLLFPFLFGIYILMKSLNTARYLALFSTLIFPSILSEKILDLNRLVILLPIIIFIISFGVIKIIESQKRELILIGLLMIIFIFFEVTISIFDIKLRDYIRLERAWGTHLKIDRQ